MRSVFKYFIVWRILIFLPIFVAPFFLELQKNFLGGGLQNYLSNPYFWSWANFDGEHYINIARLGYANGEQAFFPFYPMILKFFSLILGFQSPDLFVFCGIIISNVAFILALIGLYKLVRLDYPDDIAKLTILLILFFPASFYFAAVYTESLFLVLVVWSFYYFRMKKLFLGVILGSLSSLTRVVGIIPIGLLSYMGYSKYAWNDYLAFFHSVKNFGEQRSDHLILLPQVFYRYFVKIIPNLSWNYLSVVFTTMLEILVAAGFLTLIFYSFKKIRLEYWLFLTLGYLIPTFSGSFSSLPRYVVVLFPAFIYMAIVIKKLKINMTVGIFSIMFIIAIIAQALFVRGYFVS